MSQEFVNIASPPGNYSEAALEEIFQLRRDAFRELRRFWKTSYVSENSVLIWQISKRRLACDHFVDGASQRPNICVPVMSLTFDNLRSHVAGSSYKTFGLFILAKNLLRSSKISQFAKFSSFKNICRFNISMDNSFGMEVFQTIEYFFRVDLY